MLWMFQRVVFGPVTHEENSRLSDLSLRERLVFAPLLVLIFWMGFAPQPFLDRMQPALDRTLQLTNERAGLSQALVQPAALRDLIVWRAGDEKEGRP
jgi:NADH-quinone oxidoreductase subunit M